MGAAIDAIIAHGDVVIAQDDPESLVMDVPRVVRQAVLFTPLLPNDLRESLARLSANGPSTRVGPQSAAAQRRNQEPKTKTSGVLDLGRISQSAPENGRWKPRS